MTTNEHHIRNLIATMWRELVDPTRSELFTLADRNAMTYVGERFAEFLAERQHEIRLGGSRVGHGE